MPQVKAPKIYLRDSGLVHALLGIANEKALMTHPKLGASWEGFVIDQILASVEHDAAYFWATHQGAEIDLIRERVGQRIGIEIKRSDGPTITPSMRNALQELGLSRIVVIYPGSLRYALSDAIEVMRVSLLAKPRALAL